MPDDNLLAQLLKRATSIGPDKGTDEMLGWPFTRKTYPGSWHDQEERHKERAGLPGYTPEIDPRLVNPKNSPMMSLHGLTRGDINLDHNPEFFPQGFEDFGNYFKYYDEWKKRGKPMNMTAPILRDDSGK